MGTCCGQRRVGSVVVVGVAPSGNLGGPANAADRLSRHHRLGPLSVLFWTTHVWKQEVRHHIQHSHRSCHLEESLFVFSILEVSGVFGVSDTLSTPTPFVTLKMSRLSVRDMGHSPSHTQPLARLRPMAFDEHQRHTEAKSSMCWPRAQRSLWAFYIPA
jgi:hypothetical protein